MSNYVHFIDAIGTPSSTSFTVAVQGCSHGELDSIYDALEAYRTQHLTTDDPNNPRNIDVLLCCGDVQTLRNTDDFHSLAVPDKYKAMGDFHAYYSGQKVAPILTIMIGGNHESSNYLQELYYGGWVAPNIYYLGAAGVVNLCKRSAGSSFSLLRIAGVSGIYNSKHYTKGRFEMPPYSQGDLRSVYHTRQIEIERLRAFASGTGRSSSSSSIDIMMSHDWPRNIYHHGNLPLLLQRKPFFKDEIDSGSLGSPANESLLHSLKPKHWFAAHLHVKFEACVRHKNDNTSTQVAKPAASTKFHGVESNDGICPDNNESNMETLTDQMTRFLSLDKCLPKRRHIQILHVEPSSSKILGASDAVSAEEVVFPEKAWLEYDPSWLAVLRRTDGWTQRTHNVVRVSEDSFVQNPITDDEVSDVTARLEQICEKRRFAQGGNAVVYDEHDGASTIATKIPHNFATTVPPYNPHAQQSYSRPSPMIGNPQTDQFLEMLGLEHRITVPFCADAISRSAVPSPPLSGTTAIESVQNCEDENEIDLDHLDDEDDADADKLAAIPSKSVAEDPDKIQLDELEDGDDEGGDTIFYTPGSIAKRPRNEE